MTELIENPAEYYNILASLFFVSCFVESVLRFSGFQLFISVVKKSMYPRALH